MNCFLLLIFVFQSIFQTGYSAKQIIALPGEVPYQVAIFLNGKFHCNGALARYKEKHQIVITQGYCVSNYNDNDKVIPAKGLEIYAGVYNITDLTKAEARSVDKVVRAPGWIRGGLINDLAILRFKHDFPLTENIQHIQIPESGNWWPEKGHQVIASAWGYTSVYQEVDHKMFPILKRVDLRYLPPKDCKQKYQDFIKEDTNFCVETDYKAVGDDEVALLGVCYGDFGGTLILEYDQLPGPYLFGIFSWAQPGCGRQTEPAKYTKVDAYLKWIMDAGYDGKK